MEKSIPEAKSPFATEPIGRLIAKFAIPCVISLLVTIFYKGIMPSEKILDLPVDCNTLTGCVNS